MGFQFRKLTCLQRKIQRKMHTNQNKCQVENCPALPGRSLISTCNRRMKSVTAGRVEISFQQTETCNHHLNWKPDLNVCLWQCSAELILMFIKAF